MKLNFLRRGTVIYNGRVKYTDVPACRRKKGKTKKKKKKERRKKEKAEIRAQSSENRSGFSLSLSLSLGERTSNEDKRISRYSRSARFFSRLHCARSYEYMSHILRVRNNFVTFRDIKFRNGGFAFSSMGAFIGAFYL